MKSKDFATWLDRTIKERGWSINECARRAGISHTAVRRIIIGETVPTWATVGPLAYVLKVPFMSMYRMAGVIPIHESEEDQEEWDERSALPVEVGSDDIDYIDEEITYFQLHDRVKKMTHQERVELLRFAVFMDERRSGEL